MSPSPGGAYGPILLPFFLNDTATTEIYPLSLHDALPISQEWEDHPANAPLRRAGSDSAATAASNRCVAGSESVRPIAGPPRSGSVSAVAPRQEVRAIPQRRLYRGQQGHSVSQTGTPIGKGVVEADSPKLSIRQPSWPDSPSTAPSDFPG